MESSTEAGMVEALREGGLPAREVQCSIGKLAWQWARLSVSCEV